MATGATTMRWDVDGTDVLTGGADYLDGRPALVVPSAVRDVYFSDVPAIYNNAPEGDPWAAWLIDQERVPLDKVLDAVWSLRTGRYPTATPGASAPGASATPESPASAAIAPPSVGDAGLADPDFATAP